MRKPLSLAVAALFALSTGSVFAASHAGAKMDDKDQKTDAKKTDAKKTGAKDAKTSETKK